MFLNLIIYSNNNEYYEKMKILQRNYLKKFRNLKYYFIFYNEITTNSCGNVNIIDDEIIIDGKESLVPGILDKTLKSIIQIHMNYPDFDYKYLIRSNISTIINFNKLEKFINDYNIKYPQIPIHYGGGYSEILQWLDIPSGIVNNHYWGVEFVQGTNIILSKYAVDNLISDYINRSDTLDMNVVDDVAIAIYFARNHKKYKSLTHHIISNQYKSLISTEWNIIVKIPGFVFINDINVDIQSIYIDNIWCYRHKTSKTNRENDYLLMKKTIENINRALYNI